jgi:hypothetical protein
MWGGGGIRTARPDPIKRPSLLLRPQPRSDTQVKTARLPVATHGHMPALGCPLGCRTPGPGPVPLRPRDPRNRSRPHGERNFTSGPGLPAAGSALRVGGSSGRSAASPEPAARSPAPPRAPPPARPAQVVRDCGDAAPPRAQQGPQGEDPGRQPWSRAELARGSGRTRPAALRTARRTIAGHGRARTHGHTLSHSDTRAPTHLAAQDSRLKHERTPTDSHTRSHTQTHPTQAHTPIRGSHTFRLKASIPDAGLHFHTCSHAHTHSHRHAHTHRHAYPLILPRAQTP